MRRDGEGYIVCVLSEVVDQAEQWKVESSWGWGTGWELEHGNGRGRHASKRGQEGLSDIRWTAWAHHLGQRGHEGDGGV